MYYLLYNSHALGTDLADFPDFSRNVELQNWLNRLNLIESSTQITMHKHFTSNSGSLFVIPKFLLLLRMAGKLHCNDIIKRSLDNYLSRPYQLSTKSIMGLRTVRLSLLFGDGLLNNTHRAQTVINIVRLLIYVVRRSSVGLLTSEPIISISGTHIGLCVMQRQLYGARFGISDSAA